MRAMASATIILLLKHFRYPLAYPHVTPILLFNFLYRPLPLLPLSVLTNSKPLNLQAS